jgi:hypothetical protein
MARARSNRHGRTRAAVLGGEAPAAFAVAGLLRTGEVAFGLGIIGGTILWGYGAWWLLLAVLKSARYFRHGIPFNLGWWGFIFPLGVYSLATLALARVGVAVGYAFRPPFAGVGSSEGAPFIRENVNIATLPATRNSQLIHIFLPPVEISNWVKAQSREGAVVEALDFRDEAKGCLQLAEVEDHPEVKTILMGMALGWLTLADQLRSAAPIQYEHADDA